MNKKDIKRVVLLAVGFLIINLGTQYFGENNLDIMSALIGTIIFTVFVILGVMSSKK